MKIKKTFSEADSKVKKLNKSVVLFSLLMFVLVINDNKLNIEPTVKTSNPEVITENKSKNNACFFLLNDKTTHNFFNSCFI